MAGCLLTAVGLGGSLTDLFGLDAGLAWAISWTAAAGLLLAGLVMRPLLFKRSR